MICTPFDAVLPFLIFKFCSCVTQEFFFYWFAPTGFNSLWLISLTRLIINCIVAFASFRGLWLQPIIFCNSVWRLQCAGEVRLLHWRQVWSGGGRQLELKNWNGVFLWFYNVYFYDTLSCNFSVDTAFLWFLNLYFSLMGTVKGRGAPARAAKLNLCIFLILQSVFLWFCKL